MLFSDLSLAQIVGIGIALVVGITFHEFSHAFTADQLGDHRPRALGRVSLNPLAHLDPMGTIVFLLAAFGWGKPVPVNVYALRAGRTGMAIVAGAGPVANIVVALLAAAAYRAMDLVGTSGFVLDVGWSVVAYNLVLAVFNLLPIPPLDGYNVVLAFVPARVAFAIQRYAPYGVIVLLLLVFLPGSPLGLVFGWIAGVTNGMTGA